MVSSFQKYPPNKPRLTIFTNVCSPLPLKLDRLCDLLDQWHLTESNILRLPRPWHKRTYSYWLGVLDTNSWDATSQYTDHQVRSPGRRGRLCVNILVSGPGWAPNINRHHMCEPSWTSSLGETADDSSTPNRLTHHVRFLKPELISWASSTT